jgi:amidase
VVRRLRGAGAVVLGVTRLSEVGGFGVTDDVTGVTRNPWRTDRTPGGSSGGAAAAVAAGLVPIAHANDGMGSIRIPAACCGLVGVKPGRGVVPSDTDTNDLFAMSEHGMLATTVGDAALGFFVLAGRTPQRLVPPPRLRVACSLRSPVPGVWPDNGARRSLSAAARALVTLGHDAVWAHPAYPFSAGVRSLATWFATAYVEAEATGVDLDDLQPRSRRQVSLGKLALGRGLVREVDRAAWRERCRDWFASGRIDVLVTPALAAAPRADWATRSWSSNIATSLRYAPYAAPWTVAGFPAVVVPVGVRSDGLPAAVQLVGPPGSELTLLSVAGQLEQLTPWRRHAPGWPRGGNRRWRA